MMGFEIKNSNIPTLEELKKESEQKQQLSISNEIEEKLLQKREEQIEEQIVRYIQIAKGIQSKESVGVNGLADTIVAIAQMIQIENVYGGY